MFPCSHSFSPYPILYLVSPNKTLSYFSSFLVISTKRHTPQYRYSPTHFLILSYLILSYLILSYLILSYLILSPFSPLFSSILFYILTTLVTAHRIAQSALRCRTPTPRLQAVSERVAVYRSGCLASRRTKRGRVLE